jgi:hypothetical protein
MRKLVPLMAWAGLCCMTWDASAGAWESAEAAVGPIGRAIPTVHSRIGEPLAGALRRPKKLLDLRLRTFAESRRANSGFFEAHFGRQVIAFGLERSIYVHDGLVSPQSANATSVVPVSPQWGARDPLYVGVEARWGW